MFCCGLNSCVGGELMVDKIRSGLLQFSRSDIKNVILVWILFTSTAPFQFYAMIPYHPYKLLVLLVVVVMLAVMLRDGIKKSNNVIFYILIIQAIYSLLTIFIHAISLDSFYMEDGYIYLNLFIQLIVVFISFAFINNYGLLHKVAVSTVPVMVVMAAFGVVILFLGLIVNIQPFSFTALADHRDISNYILTFSSSVSDLGFASIIRSAGYFDEPGTFAYYITIVLLINKMYGYSKLAERLLIGFGLCTMSLAFFISVTLYYFIFGMLEGRLKVVIWMAVIAGLVISAIVELKDRSEIGRVVYELTVYRVLPPDESEDKLFKGDNRSENFAYAKQAFSQAPFFGHGMSAHTNEKNEFVGKLCCNPLHPLATEGLVGTFIYFLVFIYWGFLILKNKPFDYISAGAWIIIFINMMQRPGFSGGTFGYFVFIFLLEATRWRIMQQRLTLPRVVSYQASSTSVGKN